MARKSSRRPARSKPVQLTAAEAFFAAEHARWGPGPEGEVLDMGIGAAWSIVCSVLGGPFGRMPVGSAREVKLRTTYRGIIDEWAGASIADFNDLLVDAAKVYNTTTLPAPTATDLRRAIPDAQTGLVLVRAFWAGLQLVDARTHGLRLSGLGWEITFREDGADCQAVDPAAPPALAWTRPASRAVEDPRLAKVRDLLACLWELAAASPDRETGRARLHDLAERILPTDYRQQPPRPDNVLAVFDPLNSMLSTGGMVYRSFRDLQERFGQRGEWKRIAEGRRSPKVRGGKPSAKGKTIAGEVQPGYDHDDLPAYETDPDRAQRIRMERHLARKASGVDATLETWCRDRDNAYYGLIKWRGLLQRVRTALPAMISADGVPSRVDWRDRAARWLNTIGGYWPGSESAPDAGLPALEDAAWLDGFGKTLAIGDELFRELKGWTFSAGATDKPNTGRGSSTGAKKLPKRMVEGALLSFIVKGGAYRGQRQVAAMINAHPSNVADVIKGSNVLRKWAKEARKTPEQAISDGVLGVAELVLAFLAIGDSEVEFSGSYGPRPSLIQTR